MQALTPLVLSPKLSTSQNFCYYSIINWKIVTIGVRFKIENSMQTNTMYLKTTGLKWIRCLVTRDSTKEFFFLNNSNTIHTITNNLTEWHLHLETMRRSVNWNNIQIHMRFTMICRLFQGYMYCTNKVIIIAIALIIMSGFFVFFKLSALLFLQDTRINLLLSVKTQQKIRFVISSAVIFNFTPYKKLFFFQKTGKTNRSVTRADSCSSTYQTDGTSFCTPARDFNLFGRRDFP